MSAQPAQRLEKILARVAREQGLDQERLLRWVSFLALCGVLEQAVERGVIDTYYLKGGVAMELRFARAAPTTDAYHLSLRNLERNVLYGLKFLKGGTAPSDLGEGFPQSVVTILDHTEALGCGSFTFEAIA